MKEKKASRLKRKKTSTKTPVVDKFERIFKDIGVEPNKRAGSVFSTNEQSTWIVSDNNSSFKNFANHG